MNKKKKKKKKKKKRKKKDLEYDLLAITGCLLSTMAVKDGEKALSMGAIDVVLVNVGVLSQSNKKKKKEEIEELLQKEKKKKKKRKSNLHSSPEPGILVLTDSKGVVNLWHGDHSNGETVPCGGRGSGRTREKKGRSEEKNKNAVTKNSFVESSRNERCFSSLSFDSARWWRTKSPLFS